MSNIGTVYTLYRISFGRYSRTLIARTPLGL